MRGVILLLFLLVLIIVVLSVYIMRLKRKIRESDNPALALTRKERAKYARAELNRIERMQDLVWQDRLDEYILRPLPYRKDA